MEIRTIQEQFADVSEAIGGIQRTVERHIADQVKAMADLQKGSASTDKAITALGQHIAAIQMALTTCTYNVADAIERSTNIVLPLVETIKRLEARIEELEARVD